MNKLQPYRGKYVSASSASKYLDVDTILKGCNQVDAEAKEIPYVKAKLNSAGSSINSNALSIDNITVDDSLGECLDGIQGVYENILSGTEQVREAAIYAYNKIQSDLNEDASYRNQQAIASARNQEKNSQ